MRKSKTEGCTLELYLQPLVLVQSLVQVYLPGSVPVEKSLIIVSIALVLGLTAHGSKKASHVPSDVYISIVTLQSVGFLVASLLGSPSKVYRKDGKAIVQSLPKTWREELMSLPRSIMTPSVLLTSMALFSCQMIFSLAGSLNAFCFNARTRALVNVSLYCKDGKISVLISK